jgi:DnaK suppressor protein
MTQKEKETLRDQMEQDIDALKKQIAQLEEKAKPIAPDCSLGRLTRMEAMGEQEVNRKILDASKLRFTRLTHALSRIEKPMFGFCIECEEPIPFERMRIRPESVRCVHCENQFK